MISLAMSRRFMGLIQTFVSGKDVFCCGKDNNGKYVVEEDKLMDVWRSHYD